MMIWRVRLSSYMQYKHKMIEEALLEYDQLQASSSSLGSPCLLMGIPDNGSTTMEPNFLVTPPQNTCALHAYWSLSPVERCRTGLKRKLSRAALSAYYRGFNGIFKSVRFKVYTEIAVEYRSSSTILEFELLFSWSVVFDIITLWFNFLVSSSAGFYCWVFPRSYIKSYDFQED